MLPKTASTITLLAIGCFGWLCVVSPQAYGDNSRIERAVAVLELYVGDDRPTETGAYTQSLREALAQSAGVALLSRQKAHRILAQSALRTTWIDPAELAQLKRNVDEAANLLVKSTKASIPVLEKTVETLDGTNARVIYNDTLHTITFRAYMLLARAYLDTGNRAQMLKVLERVMRQVGSEEVTEENYHPNIVQGWRTVRKRLAPQRTASLSVETRVPGAQVIVRGRQVTGQTPLSVQGLLPGQVQVQIKIGKSYGVAHSVTLKPGESTQLSIDLSFDRSLDMSGGRLAMRFPSESAFKQHAGTHAARIGRILDVDKVVLSGLFKVDGQTRFRAVLVDVATGRNVFEKTARAKTNVVIKQSVNALAQTLAATAGARTSLPTLPLAKNWLGWTGIGLSVVSFVISGVLWSDFNAQMFDLCAEGYSPAEKKCTSPQAEREAIAREAVKSTYTPALAMSIAGGAFALGGILAFVLLKEKPKATAWQRRAPSFELKALGPSLLPGNGAGIRAHFSF